MSDTSSSSFSELKDNEPSGASSTSIPIRTSLTGVDKPLPTTVAKPDSAKKATLSSDYATLFVASPHPAYTADWFVFYLKQTRVLVILGLLLFFLVLVIWVATLGKAGAMAAYNSAAVCPQWAGAELVPNVVSSCPPARAEVYYAGSPSSGGVRIDGNTVTQQDVSLQPLAIFLPNAVGGYYYTAVFLDEDWPNRRSPAGRSHLLGLVTNLRLGQSADTNGGDWFVPYRGPTVIDPDAHRYIWLVYRHSSANSVREPAQYDYGFMVEEWLSTWPQRPTLVAAAWFEAAGNR